MSLEAELVSSVDSPAGRRTLVGCPRKKRAFRPEVVPLASMPLWQNNGFQSNWRQQALVFWAERSA